MGSLRMSCSVVTADQGCRTEMDQARESNELKPKDIHRVCVDDACLTRFNKVVV